LSKDSYAIYEYLQTAISKRFVKLEILIIEEDLNFAVKYLNATRIYVTSDFGFNSFATS
jgi:hypothetical protein